ncbi:hypothetical protein BpHYR1_051489 [Brachionus plicatilis]|uniref:Uncharacterized protein n=1 Tax=Brachionus plicatilis TaxID=10195 RepID=A0A3M7QK17_BRAPC|nr:hypothetical protein BpHYR1_051489 [Brachionus plicatilis]
MMGELVLMLRIGKKVSSASISDQTFNGLKIIFFCGEALSVFKLFLAFDRAKLKSIFSGIQKKIQKDSKKQDPAHRIQFKTNRNNHLDAEFEFPHTETPLMEAIELENKSHSRMKFLDDFYAKYMAKTPEEKIDRICERVRIKNNRKGLGFEQKEAERVNN